MKNKISKIIGGTVICIFTYNNNKLGIVIRTKDEKDVQVFIDNPQNVLLLEQEIIAMDDGEVEFFMNIEKAE